MDPVAHTLAGAVLGKAGLERRSALAMPTLLIGANLPDVDVAAYWWGETFALTFRRGWTHGVLALAVLPLLLTGIMLAWDRFVRRARDPAAPPAIPGILLALSALAVVSHPLLDLLNVYGVRLLMPFSDRWFYGDSLFIMDPWFWLILVAGVLLARKAVGARAARVALAVWGLYVGGMVASAVAARWVVWRAIPFARAGVDALMVGPEPLTPFRRWIVLDEGHQYRVGGFDWRHRPPVRYDELVVLPKGNADSVAAAVSRIREAREFLSWARFPVFRLRDDDVGTVVELVDVRYAVDADARFGALTVRLPP